jgi:multidrug efflux pump subunit AcrA (membrane-fusion protein)
LLALGATALTGCGKATESTAQGAMAAPAVITVAPVATRSVRRTIEMVGTLKGWEQVTVGTKRTGRVVETRFEMGDRVHPGDVLVKLDPVDAGLAKQQATTKYMSELIKLGLTEQQAEKFLKKFKIDDLRAGTIDDRILRDEEVKGYILKVPAIVQAKFQVEKAKLDMDRQGQLYERSSGSLQQLQDYRNAYDTARAAFDNAIVQAQTVLATAISNYVAYKQAEQALDDMIIAVPALSPAHAQEVDLAKVVFAATKRSVAEGQMVREGEAVAELVIEDPLRLWGNVPERFSNEVRTGQGVIVRVAAFDKEFQGTVARINPAVDPVSRTFQVEVKIRNPENLLRPGGFAKADIITRQDEQALVVPRDAIEKFAGVTKIFVVTDPEANRLTVRTVPVTIGVEEAGSVEVRGDLKAGDQVAVSNLAQLADDSVVAIRKGPGGEGEEISRGRMGDAVVK